ncbi:hypothetical protein P3T29_006242 [Kitasatospora sp. MAP5-34]|nr:hypothetical protein [Kitasatospora sp. MAP5-34]
MSRRDEQAQLSADRAGTNPQAIAQAIARNELVRTCK